MNRLFIVIVMLFICLSAYPQPDSGRIRLLLTESSTLRKSGQREIGQRKVDEAIQLLKEGTNHALLGQAWFEKSSYYDYDYKDQTIRTRIHFIELAIAAGKQTNDIQNLAFYYCTLGDLHHLISEYAKAAEELNSSLKYYQSIQYKEMQLVYGLLGKVYYLQGDYDLALNHELKALQIAERNKDTTYQLSAILNNLGFIYYKLNDGENALTYFKRSLDIAERDKDILNIYLIASNVAEAYLKLKQPTAAKDFLDGINHKYAKPKNKTYEAGDVAINKVWLRLYMALKQYDKAKLYCDQLIREAKNPRINLSILNAWYIEIIQYYIATSQYTYALDYLKKNEALLDSLKDGVGMARNYNLWFSLDTSQGNYQAAIVNVLKANRISDSIFNEKKSRQWQQLNVQYESEKKEAQIQVLTQKELLQQSNLRQANLIKDITIGGILILLTAILLFYRHYRHKQRTNTIITDQNKQLKHLLTEKEWLLKEIHHRVKNNLQIVMSLLNSQSAYIDNEPALTAIHDSQHRVQAMSLIHQKLYGSESLSSIDMSIYIRELVSYLADSFDTTQRIRFTFDIGQLEMDVSQAVPLGLILNEAITNAIKYAFPNGRTGVIAISLKKTALDHYLLTISDDGIGLPSHYKTRQPGSLGMTLMAGLSEDLDGHFAIENHQGTTIKISFVHAPGFKRPVT